MSNFVKEVGEKKYFCLDDFFGIHQYGYVEMTEEERKSESPWELLEYSQLRGRGGDRRVFREIPNSKSEMKQPKMQ